MKLLLDICVWGGAAAELQTAGYDVVWSGEWEDDPGDEAILATAHAHRRISVTLDKDFGELAIVFRQPHSGIVRLVDFSARRQAEICMRILDVHGAELEAGAMVTAERGRLRIREPAHW